MKTSNLVQKLYNKANKSSIAIDCLSYVEKGVYYLTDLDSYLSLPVELIDMQ